MDRMHIRRRGRFTGRVAGSSVLSKSTNHRSSVREVLNGNDGGDKEQKAMPVSKACPTGIDVAKVVPHTLEDSWANGTRLSYRSGGKNFSVMQVTGVPKGKQYTGSVTESFVSRSGSCGLGSRKAYTFTVGKSGVSKDAPALPDTPNTFVDVHSAFYKGGHIAKPCSDVLIQKYWCGDQSAVNNPKKLLGTFEVKTRFVLTKGQHPSKGIVNISSYELVHKKKKP